MNHIGSHQLAPSAALKYIFAGKGKFTLVGKANRFTYRTQAIDNGLTFVRVLAGSDSWVYIGAIKSGRLYAGKRGSPNAASFKALAWYLETANQAPQIAAKAECWHEGVCGRCGRPLTVPSSIESGLGPICAEKMAHAA